MEHKDKEKEKNDLQKELCRLQIMIKKKDKIISEFKKKQDDFLSIVDRCMYFEEMYQEADERANDLVCYLNSVQEILAQSMVECDELKAQVNELKAQFVDFQKLADGEKYVLKKDKELAEQAAASWQSKFNEQENKFKRALFDLNQMKKLLEKICNRYLVSIEEAEIQVKEKIWLENELKGLNIDIFLTPIWLPDSDNEEAGDDMKREKKIIIGSTIISFLIIFIILGYVIFFI